MRLPTPGRDNPETWVGITRSTEPKADAVLAAWDTIQNPDGVYRVRLTAQNTAGGQRSKTVTIVIQNAAPARSGGAAQDSSSAAESGP